MPIAFTPVDATTHSDGELRPVAGHIPFDVSGLPMRWRPYRGCAMSSFAVGHGYDHNWVLNKGAEESRLRRGRDRSQERPLARGAYHPAGVQFYSGNFMDGKPAAGGGSLYAHRTGLCLETQHFPDREPRRRFRQPSAPWPVYSEKTILAVLRWSSRGPALEGLLYSTSSLLDVQRLLHVQNGDRLRWQGE